MVLAISVLVDRVSLGMRGLVAEDGVGALANVKVRFTLLLLHESVGLLSS